VNARYPALPAVAVAVAVALLASPARPQQSAAATLPPAPDVQAPIVLLLDLGAGATLFARNADRRIPPASMAKMMTVEVAFDLLSSGAIRPDKSCTVRPETWRQWHSAGSTMFLAAGEQVKVADLLHGVVTLSGNDASVVLAECLAGSEAGFVRLMNQQAAKLGLRNSRFGNATGWPDEGRTYVTARDLAALAAATIRQHPQLYRHFYGQPNFTWGATRGSGRPITQGNRNPILGRVAGADGLKTGHTEEAGFGFTGSATQGGRRLVVVVAGLPSAEARASESVALIRWGFEQWDAEPLFRAGQRVGEAEVQLGASSAVPLLAPRPRAAVVPRGHSGPLELKIRYRGPLKAPVAQGRHVADLVVSGSPGGPQAMPLVAGESVQPAGALRRAWIGLRQMLGWA
jgi:serine-type D-Ala-D-Ala carboxypeptidase (penicillin-binding protein 5/6)